MRMNHEFPQPTEGAADAVIPDAIVTERGQSQTERLRLYRKQLGRSRRAGRERRGVLLLVVLSMLVLFLLIGTTFVLTTSSFRNSAKVIEKKHQTSLQPGDRLERALLHILRDTNNPHSAVRFHSLLRDVYGSDGFVGHAYAGPLRNQNITTGYNVPVRDGFRGPPIVGGGQPEDPNRNHQYMAQFPGADFSINPADVLGPTQGQFIDIYLQDDCGLLVNQGEEVGLPPEYVVDLELNSEGLTTNHRLSRVGGYYNGCLLTILEGPARAQTARIVEYDAIPLPPFGTGPGGTDEYLHRFRVLAFTRQDGTPVQLGNTVGTNDLIVGTDLDGNSILNDNDSYRGVRLMVNGRPYNGLGVGHNQLAGISDAKLSAVERVQLASTPGQFIGIEPALAPNAAYFQPLTVSYFNALSPSATARSYAGNRVEAFEPLTLLYDNYAGPGGSDESYDAADFQNMFLALQPQVPRAQGRVTNDALAQSGEAQEIESAGAVQVLNGSPNTNPRLDLSEVPIPSFHRAALVNFWMHRLYKSPWLIASVTDPQQRVRAILSPYDDNGQPAFGLSPAVAAQIVAIKRKINLRPLREDHPNFDGSNPASRYASRPSPLTGSGINRYVNDRGTTGDPVSQPQLLEDDEITFPYWEATGPWDVDNDNDGTPDSIWVDLGDPVQELGDGRMYKPLYAILIEDMDGRLNLNAHGSADHFAAADLDGSTDNSANQNFNLPSGASVLLGLSASHLVSSNQLAHGSGWGPGDITLRPILSPEFPQARPGAIGDPLQDDYARLFVGRVVNPVDNPAAAVAGETTWGRYGSLEFTLGAGLTAADLNPGISFNVFNPAVSLDPLSQLEFADFPQVGRKAIDRLLALRAAGVPLPANVIARLNQMTLDFSMRNRLRGQQPTSYGELPDLRGRYSGGLDYRGQPIVESSVDRQLPTLVADAPYEVNLMSDSRRDAPDLYNPVQNDDAPFSVAELERVLRAMDPDAGGLPDRLWNLVDAFDPDKLLVQLTGANPLQLPPGYNSGDVVSAQVEASARRRVVTTDSFEVPAPNENWTARLVYGADGRPGAGGVDENQNWDGSVPDGADLDEATEFGFYFDGSNTVEIKVDALGNVNAVDAVAAFQAGVDDYHVVMGAAPPKSARLLDYLRYRVTLELKRRGVIPVDVFPAAHRKWVFDGGGAAAIAAMDAAEQDINNVIYGDNSLNVADVRTAPASFGGLVAPEVIQGLKMDLNRPFGDGRDNNGNGVVDEELEAGEPWIDTDGSGFWNSGEPFLDLDNDGRFYADSDNDGIVADPAGVLDPDDLRDYDGDGVFEPVTDSLWQQQYGQPIAFDHANGKDANGRGAVTAAGVAVVHDDGRMARQLYARHLYCLMLLNMDEGYIAPFDPKDPQVMHYLNPDSATRTTELQPDGTREINRSVARQIKLALMAADPSLSDDDASAEARRQALRKLTCRKIAQWAINAADMRDPDASMTPFEYDENPWDGWGVYDTGQAGSDPTNLNNDRLYPLDGALNTDENRQYTQRVLPNGTGWDLPGRVEPNGNAIPADRVVPAYDQTRGVVWGTERPELLLTEGLALHDRRVSNETAGGTIQTDAEAKSPDPLTGEDENDLDQFYKPSGAAFVEIYNPWSADGAMPAELYRDSAGNALLADMNRNGSVFNRVNDPTDVSVEGVRLDRLSNGTAPVRDVRGNIKQANGGPIIAPSPVWRMICVEQHPQLRNDDPLDNEIAQGNATYAEFPNTTGAQANFGLVGGGAPQAYVNVAAENLQKETFIRNALGGAGADLIARLRTSLTNNRGSVPNPVRIANPDFPTFDPDATPVVDQQGIRFKYIKPLEYIEREWYFTREAEFQRTQEAGRTNDAIFDPADVRLCIPDKPVRVKLVQGDPFTQDLPLVSATGVEWPGRNEPSDVQTQLWREGIVRENLRGGTDGDLLIYPRHFPPVQQVPNDNTGRRYTTIPLAPIMPGQFGVIGSAGTEYDQMPGEYITRIGRGLEEDAAGLGTADTVIRGSRRIELVPNPNPFLHQVVVGRNFGDEFKLLAPAGRSGYLVNATDPSQVPLNATSPASNLATEVGGNRIISMKEFNDSPNLPAFYTYPNLNDGARTYEIDPDEADQMRLYSIRPAVAIPIENMNISKPVDNYILRRAEIDQQFTIKWEPDEYVGEGTYGVKGATASNGFDEPFDIQPELALNHTTPNYRSVHLQRLANPLLAWNPPALKINGTVHPQHDPARPVNPYLTVDSMSLDVTAYNSINRDEEDLDPINTNAGANGPGLEGERGNIESRTDAVVDVLAGSDPVKLHEQPHDRPGKSSALGGGEAGSNTELRDTKKIIMTLGSQYRGYHEMTLEYADETGTNLPPEVERTLQPSQVIWKQERPNQFIDVLDERLDTASVAEATGGRATQTGEDANTIARVGVSSLLGATGNQGELAFDFVLSHSLGFDNRAVIREYFLNPEYQNPPVTSLREDRRFYKGKVVLNGVFSSNFTRDPFSTNAQNYVYRVDVNGDGIMGDIVGAPQINESNLFLADDPRTGDAANPLDETGNPDYRDNVTMPWMVWNDRPYLSANELLHVPASSPATLTREFSLTNPFTSDPPSRYDGFATPLPDNNSTVGAVVDQGATETNQARIGATNYPFGHLLNMFQASNSPAVALRVGDQAIPVGAPHFHRILDYVHTPSRFVATDSLMNPLVFDSSSVNLSADPLGDPRRAWQAPFNRVAQYREPGKVNLNTVIGRRDPAEPLDLWSDVYDGLMHRVQDGNAISYNDPGNATDDVLGAIGHLGPAWRDVVVSRRGYAQKGYILPQPTGPVAQVLDYSQDRLNPSFPSRFANPFRSADAGDLVPLQQMVMPDIDASLLRAHHFSPGADGEWGFADEDDGIVNGNNMGTVIRDNPNQNPDSNFLVDDAREAGTNQAIDGSNPRQARARDQLLMRLDEAIPNSVRDALADIKLPVSPLFSAGTSEASLDAGRNAGIQYQPMTRLANLTSSRSGVFAVWITVGFFEVTPAPDWNDTTDADRDQIRARFGNDRDLYDRVYPEGYQLGQEIGSETGDIQRFKAFYIVDRTRPVAFKPGEDINSEKAILLRRRIE